MTAGKCALCAETGYNELYSGIVSCRSCGHVYARPGPREADARGMYSRGYFFGGEYSDYLADKRVTQENFRLRLNVLDAYVQRRRHTRLLEVGCAYGFFLEVARTRFDRVMGVDIAEDGVRHAVEKLGADAVNADLLSYDFSGQTFDVVCLWDTIEHLADPAAYLEKISRALIDPGGLVAITTGDIGSFNARFRKGKWRLLHAPSHLHFFSARSLAALLESKGFEIVYARHCGFYRSIDMVLHRILSVTGFGRKCYELLCASGVSRAQLYLNLGDIIYMIGRKK